MLLVVVGLAVFVWLQLQTRLQFHVTSDPEGAVVTVGSAWGSYRTPADVSVLFDPDERGAVELQAKSGSKLARGRIGAWDGGFKASFNAIVHRVESLDGSAWVWNPIRFRAQVEVHFPVREKFAFVHPCRGIDGFTWNGEVLDDYRGVVFMPEGAHEIANARWVATLDAAEGFCVEWTEGGGDPDGLRLSFEPDQVRSGRLTVNGEEVPFTNLDQTAAPEGSSCRLQVEALDGARCDVSIRPVSPGSPLNLRLRITYGR